MVVDPAMLVIDDQQCRALPEFFVGSNGVINGGNEPFTFTDIVVRVLV